MSHPQTIQTILFSNQKTGRLFMMNLAKNKAIQIPVDAEYSLVDLGFDVQKLEDKLMKKIVKNVRAGKYPIDTDLSSIVEDYHPEYLL